MYKYIITLLIGFILSLLFIKGCSASNQVTTPTTQLNTINSVVQKQTANYQKKCDSLISVIKKLNEKISTQTTKHHKGKTALLKGLVQLDTIAITANKISVCDSLQQRTEAYIQDTDSLVCFLEQKINIQEKHIAVKDTHIVNISTAYVQMYKEATQLTADLNIANKKLKRRNRLFKVLGAITLATTTAFIITSNATH